MDNGGHQSDLRKLLPQRGCLRQTGRGLAGSGWGDHSWAFEEQEQNKQRGYSVPPTAGEEVDTERLDPRGYGGSRVWVLFPGQ